MDCPSCGLANPPEALKCDCGYDFEALKPSETPGWQINLAWSQKVAAYWSISWPAMVGSFTIVMWVRSAFPVIALGGNLVFFGIQAVLTRRLVRKNYRSFRVGILRDDGRPGRRLSMREAGRVWLWILGPQLALLLTASVVASWYGAKAPPETLRLITSLSLWLKFLLIGPYAVDLALRVRYPGFRLQPMGIRYM